MSVFSVLHGWRDVARLLNLAVRPRVEASDRPHTERVTILLPVLNESQRISLCLESLITQPAEAAEILVVDGGSTDGTQQIVARYQARDARVRLIDASPVDPSWTGKAWGLNLGLQAAQSRWILCADADVRASPQLVRSLLSHAMASGINSFSLATIQRLAGPGDALLHPALLTTLVYRFGSPGRATKNIHRALANGQCFISRRDILLSTGAILAARQSLCEDITIARRLAECGEAVGFYEHTGIIDVSMYDSWRDTWRNWPRSLVMRDQYFDWHEWLGLCKIFFLQALPLPLFLISGVFALPYWVVFPAGVLTLVRLGILAGTARAYQRRPWTFWLSPLCDLPVALKLFASALARKHVWRGRTYVRRPGGGFELAGHSQPRVNPFSRCGGEYGDRIMFHVMRLLGHVLARGRLRIRVDGLRHVPSRGPAILVARHYHHLFDGIALHWAIPRRIHLLVTLDWATRPVVRCLMAALIRAARWPMVLRSDALARQAEDSRARNRGAFSVKDLNRYRRKAMHDSITTLREGRLLVIFPEGYPNVDPHYTPKTEANEFLPFKRGFAAIAATAEKRLGAGIPIIPVGFRYTQGTRWTVQVNFGSALFTNNFSSRDLLVAHVEQQVRMLSGLAVSETVQTVGESWSESGETGGEGKEN